MAADLPVSILNTVMQIGVLIYFEGEGNLQDDVCKKPHSHFTVFKSNCFNQRLFITGLIDLLKQIFSYTYTPFILPDLKTKKRIVKMKEIKRTTELTPMSHNLCQSRTKVIDSLH